MIVILVVGGVLALYATFNPVDYHFPSCPFRYITGFKCAGCGSQRALHALLNGRLAVAFGYNPLLIIALPYILLGFAIDWLPATPARLKIRHILFGRVAIFVSMVVVMGYWVARNVWGF